MQESQGGQGQLADRFGVSASRISSILSQEVLRLKATLYHMPESFTLIDELDDGDVDTVFEWPNPAKM